MEAIRKLTRRQSLHRLVGTGVFGTALMPALGRAGEPKGPQNDQCFTDPDGTERVTRVVPLPGTISPEAQKFMSRPFSPNPRPPRAEWRKLVDRFRIGRAAEARKLFPVNISTKTIGGVRCDVINPLAMPAANRDRVLINVHGGGFVADSGSLVEGIPIAYLAKTTVVSVYYRLAPEHPFPAAVDDTVAVYRELLKTHKAKNMGLFGTSAGAVLTPQVAVKLTQLGLAVPGALGVFSGSGDATQPGDTEEIYTIFGFRGHLEPYHGTRMKEYVGSANPRDPVISPIYADLRGMPPTLFVSSTRDKLLSGTTTLHRAFLRAGVHAELVVFEALTHSFWYDYQLPESKEAHYLMADFFNRQVGA